MPSMQRIFLIAFTFTICFGFTNCLANPFRQSELPKEMPENVRMTFSENGGMAPTWYRIVVSGDEIVVEDKKMNQDEPNKWFAKITNEEKSALYKIFVENKFDLIENDERKEIVYDAESEGVQIRAGKISKRVSYGMNSPLSGSNFSRYKAVASALKAFAEKYEKNAGTVNNKFAVIRYFSSKHKSIFEKGKRLDISNADIAQVDNLLKEAVETYNEKQQAEGKIDLSEYKHQLIAVTNSAGEKEVWVNSFCGEKPNWKREIILVDDGGKCYFNVYLNLSRQTSRQFIVNGEA